MARETEKDTASPAVTDPSAVKTRRKLARKPGKPQSPKKYKVTYYLSAQAIERVGIAATMEHADKSEIVERLIGEHLRQWVVSFRGPRPDEVPEGEAGGAGE